jgi:2-C-methyl-D-erythritol 4-phosphate cytidylyltransferase
MNIALVVAGGIGLRTKNYVPKQFLTIYDKPIIIYTIENLMKVGCFDKIFVVASGGWNDFIDSYVKQYNITSFYGTISPGQTRLESVFNGIEYLQKSGFSDSTVAIIDANRPLIPSQVFIDAISLLKECDCVLPMDPCYDSMFIVDRDTQSVTSAVDRSILFKGQTPEVCKVRTGYEVLSKLGYSLQNRSLTDTMLLAGKHVKCVKGSALGFKITTADDIAIFKALVDGAK